MIYAIYSPESGQVVYANGGHNPPLIVHSDGTSTQLPPIGGLALGVAPGFMFPQDTLHLAPNETLVLYTDGVTEAMNAEREEFGVERLQAIFVNNPPTNARQPTKDIFSAVHAFTGETPQSDDITCLTIFRKPVT